MASLDPQLNKIIEYLREFQGKVADGLFAKGQRPWMNFDKVGGEGNYNYSTLHDVVFTRNDANQNYLEVRKERKSKLKDLQVTKLAGDYLAGFERDYRMLRRSRIRSLIHAGCRAKSNNNPLGPLTRNSTDWLTRIMVEDEKPKST
jgi:hypothetical protein